MVLAISDSAQLETIQQREDSKDAETTTGHGLRNRNSHGTPQAM